MRRPPRFTIYMDRWALKRSTGRWGRPRVGAGPRRRAPRLPTALWGSFRKFGQFFSLLEVVS